MNFNPAIARAPRELCHEVVPTKEVGGGCTEVIIVVERNKVFCSYRASAFKLNSSQLVD